MIRPSPNSQAGRILALLESANGGKVPLPAILNLRISQYSARIHELRHKYGYVIENGCEEGRADRTWFRLVHQLGTRLEMATKSSIPAYAKPQTTEEMQDSLFPDKAERHLDLG